MHDYYWWILTRAKTSPSRIVRSICRRILIPLSTVHGCFIPLSAHFKNKPCFPHGVHGIFISSNAHIGLNCVIFQNVTIGSSFLPDSKHPGSPVIGDSCFIGAGATIIGAIKIGNNVRIAANTTVYKDVPDNCVVTSAEQQCHIRESKLDNRYFSYDEKWKYYKDEKWKYYKDEKWHYNIDQELIAPLEKGRVNSLDVA